MDVKIDSLLIFMISTQVVLLCIFIAAIMVFLLPTKARVSRANLLHASFATVVVLTVTFRSSTMADYEQYRDAFITSNQLRFEPTFLIIKAVVNAFGDYILGFFIIALISVLLKIHNISRYKELFWSMVVVYLSNILIVQDMVAIRAGLAGSFILMGIHYKLTNKLKKMSMFLIMAFCSHYTAIVFVFLFFMDTKKLRRCFYMLLVIGSYVLSMNSLYATQLLKFVPFIGEYFVLFDKYVEEMDYQVTPMNIFNLLQMGHVMICIVFWVYIEKIKKKYPDALIYLKVYTIGICSVCWFAQSFVMAIRFSELFFIVEILLIPMGFSAIFRNPTIFKIVLITYAIIIFTIRMTDYMYWDQARLDVI